MRIIISLLMATAMMTAVNAQSYPTPHLGVGTILPPPTATVLGGVKANNAPTHQYQTGIDNTGTPLFAQPSASDVSGLAPSATTDATNATNIGSGTLACSRLPALSGDLVTSSGSCVSTLATLGTAIGPIGSATTVPVISIDGKGRVTALSSATINAPASSVISVFSYMTPTQISDVQARTLTQDVTAALQAAKAANLSLYYPCGSYKITGPLNWSGGHDFGGGQNCTKLVSYDTTDTDPIIYAGTNEVIEGMSLGYDASQITGSETLGKRVGIATWDPNTYVLQRGSAIRNIRISNVGTGIYDNSVSANSTFSATFASIEIQGFSFRGMDMEGPYRTGNVYSNIYISNYNNAAPTSPLYPNADSCFNSAGEESEASFDQINCEWATLANAIRLSGFKALHAGTIHIEEVATRATYVGLVEFKNTVGVIDALSVYYTPITHAGWFVGKFYDSTNIQGNANPTTANFIHIGTLHLHGLNDGQRVSSGNGLAGLTDFYVFDRETSAVGPYSLQIDAYNWNSYQTDTAVYAAFPNDPHNMIFLVPTINGPYITPVISSCGTGATISGTSFSGLIHVGTSATACTMTYPGAGFPNRSQCVVTGTASVSYNTSKTALNITTATASAYYNYVCNGS